MGLLSILGKIGKGALNVATGGIGGTVLDAIGGVAGGAAQGAAQGRRDDSSAMTQAQYANLAGARDQFTAGLQGQQFNASEQDRAARRAILMNLLGGVQDASIGRPAGSTIPTFNVSGGLRPSALGDRSNLLAQFAQPTMTAPTYQGPKPLDMPKAGLGEKILGGVGLGAGILGALGRRKPTSYGTPPFVPGNQSMPMPAPPGMRF